MSSTLSRRSLLALTPGLLLAACESDDIARRSGRRVYTRPRFSGRIGQQIELNKALLARGMALGNPLLIQVFKEERRLDVWMLRNDTSGFALMNRYPICYYSGQLGPKLREGDGQSPEGFYNLDLWHIRASNQGNHLFMELDFPNAVDQALGRTGSWLGIHGGCTSIGCYAMTDKAIEEIYLLVEAALLASQRSVPVHAFPFRMTGPRLWREREQPHYGFWRQLQPAYRNFETTRFPPRIEMQGYRYQISPVDEVEDY